MTALAGPHQVFADEFEPLLGKIRAHCLRLTKSPSDAEDLAQDVACRIFERIDSYTPGTNALAFGLRVATNLFIDQKRRVGFEIIPTEELPEADNVTTEAVLEEFSPEVRDAMLAVSEDQREVLILTDLIGFTYEQVAEIVGVEKGTVSSRRFRGKEAFKRAYAGLADTSEPLNPS